MHFSIIFIPAFRLCLKKKYIYILEVVWPNKSSFTKFYAYNWCLLLFSCRSFLLSMFYYRLFLSQTLHIYKWFTPSARSSFLQYVFAIFMCFYILGGSWRPKHNETKPPPVAGSQKNESWGKLDRMRVSKARPGTVQLRLDTLLLQVFKS